MNAIRRVGVLRTLFIVAFTVQAIVSIAPNMTLVGTTLHYWLNTGGTDRLVSDVDLIHFCFSLGLVVWGIYNALILVAPFALVALAIVYPRRWIFITGSVFAIYQFLFDHLGPHNNEIQVALICLVPINISRALALVGFWIKPVTCDLAAMQTANI